MLLDLENYTDCFLSSTLRKICYVIFSEYLIFSEANEGFIDEQFFFFSSFLLQNYSLFHSKHDLAHRV